MISKKKHFKRTSPIGPYDILSYPIDSVDNAVAIGILGTAQDAIIGGSGAGWFLGGAMAISQGAGAIDRKDCERPGFETSRCHNSTFGPADITGTITDTIAVGVGGATVLLDKTSLVGALWRQTKK